MAESPLRKEIGESKRGVCSRFNRHYRKPGRAQRENLFFLTFATAKGFGEPVPLGSEGSQDFP